VLAAPGFLVRDRAEGFLEDVVGPVTGSVATREVRGLCLVWADHRVRGDEVGEPGDPVDEHSRPLRLLHGFVCQDAVVDDPAPADLDRSLDAALATYRRFLNDEEMFTVEESTPFPLTTRRVAPPHPPRTNRTRVLLVAAGLVAVLLLGLWLIAGSGDEQPPEPVVPTCSTRASRPASTLRNTTPGRCSPTHDPGTRSGWKRPEPMTGDGTRRSSSHARPGRRTRRAIRRTARWRASSPSWPDRC
jgi:hypothetical protein